MKASEYVKGERVMLVTYTGAHYPVEVIGHNSLPDDLIVRWLGLRPLSALNSRHGESTICLKELKEVRRT
jgi:hypothetical protein